MVQWKFQWTLSSLSSQKQKMDLNTCSMNVTIISTVTNNNIIDDSSVVVTCLSRQKLRAHVKIAMNMKKTQKLTMIERKTKSSYTHAQPTHQINNATKWILYGWRPKKSLPHLPHDPGSCHHCTIAATDEFQQYQGMVAMDRWPRLGGTALHGCIADTGPFSGKSWRLI